MNEIPIVPGSLSRMQRTHTYGPAGRCIYCGEPATQREHIIAKALGGGLVLPESSCDDCACITSGVEGRFIHGIAEPARRQFGLPSYKKKSRPRPAQTLVLDGRKIEVADSDFPGLLISLGFDAPAILGLSQPAMAEFTGKAAVAMLPDFGQRLARLTGGRRSVSFEPLVQAADIGRMLAKIGHAYAVAELGLGGFKPYLLNVIRSPDPKFIGHFIGGAFSDPGPGDDLHEVAFDERLHPQLVVVHIRLFADRGLPSYWVVAGERT